MFSSKLDQIEAKLQALIEGSAARLFPNDKAQDDLARCLAAALWAGIQTEPDGVSLAPNHFIIYAHPVQAAQYHQNHVLLDSLADTLYQAGIETGLRFSGRLEINIIPDPALENNTVNIQAEIVPDSLEDTTRLSLRNDAIIQENQINSPPFNVFLIVDNTEIFPLVQPVINIGRASSNHLVLDDSRISRFHAQLRLYENHFVISDLDSTGGTFVNQQRIRQQNLNPGDVISLAGLNLVFGQDTGFHPVQDANQVNRQ